ncbi:hypothetical protein FOZ62_010190, partial [Perkinsus olseni]
MPEVMKISAEGADSEDDEHPRISELVFRIENVTKYKVRESIKSPTKLVELFNYQVEVYPMGEITQGFKVYIVSVPMDGVNRSITYENIEYAVTLVNHRDDRKSITCRVANDSFSTDEVSLGMNLLQGKLLPAKYPDFFDREGGIVIKARVDLSKAWLSLDPDDDDPVEGDELEFRIRDAAKFQKGEDVKSKPAWRGSCRMQIVAYPGGHPDHPAGGEELAVYIHLLGTEEAPQPLKLTVTLVNHRKLADSHTWIGTFLPDGGKPVDSWGPNRLVSIAHLRRKNNGWLDRNGALVLRASVKAADEGRDPLASI